MGDIKPFVGAIQVGLHHIDPVILSDIDALAFKIIKLAMEDEHNDGIERKPNVCLGAMQKALSIIISQYFHEKDMDGIVESITNSMKINVELWKTINVNE